jgi:hypothetical protein
MCYLSAVAAAVRVLLVVSAVAVAVLAVFCLHQAFTFLLEV